MMHDNYDNIAVVGLLCNNNALRVFAVVSVACRKSSRSPIFLLVCNTVAWDWSASPADSFPETKQSRRHLARCSRRTLWWARYSRW